MKKYKISKYIVLIGLSGLTLMAGVTARAACTDNANHCHDESECNANNWAWCSFESFCQPDSSYCPTCSRKPRMCATQTVCENAGWNWCNNFCQKMSCNPSKVGDWNSLPAQGEESSYHSTLISDAAVVYDFLNNNLGHDIKNNHSLLSHGATSAVSGPRAGLGAVHSADSNSWMYFSGTPADSIPNPHDPYDLEVGEKDWAISFWFKGNLPGGIISKANETGATNYGFAVDVNSSGRMHVSWPFTTSYMKGFNVPSVTIQSNQWYHIIIQYNRMSGNVQVIISQNTLGDVTNYSHYTGVPAMINTADFRVGHSRSTGFVGDIAEVSIWHRLLESSEQTSIVDGSWR